MGAKNIVYHLIQKLENLVHDEATSSNPKFGKQAREALRNLQLLDESLKDQDDVDLGLASARLLQAVYSVEDVTDTLLIRKEFPDIKIRENMFKKFRSPLMCFTSSSSSNQIDYLTNEMTNFKNQIRALSTDQLVNKNESAVTILNIDDVVGGIAKERMTMSFHDKQQQRWQRISGLRFEEEMNIVVGMEEQIKELVSLLIPEHNLEEQIKDLVSRLFPEEYNHNENDDHDQPNNQAIITAFLLQDPDLDRHHSAHRVIAIVGEGGTGKTTLARTVYDGVDVKQHFAKRAWVRVRGEVKVRDVLIDILQQIDDKTLVDASARERVLVSSLTRLLKKTSCLIVVEDVETPQVWKVLRDALYCNSSSGKIILTTHNAKNIPAEAEAAGSTLFLSRLNEEESWKQLLKKVPLPRVAESDYDLNNNSESINTLKDRILNICGGLPLRIGLLGGLLSTKEPNYQEWSRVIERVDNVEDNSGSGVSSLLDLCYQELPSQLKPLFHCIRHFPRTFEIPVRGLIRLWCAAATIDTDLAERYFEELVIRNLIHVTKWRLDGTPKTCRMPGAAYDAISPEAENARLFHQSSEEQQPQQEQQQQRWQRISGLCFKEEMNIVGLEDQIKELVSLLIPENNHNHNDDNDRGHSQSTHQIIAIVGEAGSGKSTLARTVYKRVDVKRHFAKRAWIRVRSDAKFRDALIDILQQIDDETLVEASAPEGELALSLTTILKEISYLIVVEDVETPQVWQVLSDALYASSKDSKIILTTSNTNNILPEPEAVGPTLRLSRLNKEESWKLMLKKVPLARVAESDNDSTNDSESINTFKERILEICGGLPLHIALLGGLLFNKEANYWSRVIERVDNSRSGSGIGSGSGVSLLALIYKELPSQLKPFFLYMGIFPRGFEIPVRRLIHLWCAEGFVAPIDTDLAEMYFEELVIRNLIQVTKWRLDGSPKMCRMPGALYGVFSAEAENAGFFHHRLQSSYGRQEQQQQQQQPPFAVRRLAAYLSGGVSSFLERSWHLRTYVAFDNRIYCSPASEISVFLDKITSNRGFVLLTVLDLEGVYKPKLSDHVIGKLLHLSYLGLRSTFIDSLPNSVGNLRHLETLDVKHTKLRYLPDSIWKAKKLQHLYLNWIHSAINWLSFSSLNNLQTLWGLSMGDDSLFNQIFDFTKLASLRKLGVKCYSQRVIDSIAELVSKSAKLQSLKLVYAWRDDYSDIPFKAQANLQELYLRGALRIFSAKTSSFPRNLKIVTLSMSRLYWDPMEALEKLCHLNILRLVGEAYEGEKMTCRAGGFPQLRVLKLWNLSCLEEWTVQEAAMPCLRELEIRSCNKLKPPQGLRNLAATLKDFALTNMPSTFGEAVQPILQGTDVYIQKNQWPPFLSLE